MPHFPARVVQSLRTIHNEMGAPALFRIGHLAGEDGFELLRRHAGAGQGAGQLDVARCRNDDCDIDFVFAPRFEQQGNVEEHQGRATGAVLGEELLLGTPHQGMDDCF